MFENNTQELGLESHFSQALIQELERSGFAIVTSREMAELVVKGSIVAASVVGSGSDPTFRAKDFSDPTEKTTTNFSASFFPTYTFTATANVKAIRSRDKQLVWQTNVSGSQTYQSARLKRQGVRSSNVLYNQARKKETIKLVAKQMMSDAFDRMTENF